MKIVSFFTALSLLISGVFTYLLCPDNEAGLNWEDEIICVYEPENNSSYVSYPRMLSLSDSTLICAYDTDSKICCVKSEDGGLNWEKEQTLIAEVHGLSCANASLIQLQNGQILCAYRANGTVDGKFYSSIRVSSSADGGKTWDYHSTVIEENQDSDIFFGVWEPHFGFIGDTLAVFYSNDSQNTAVDSTEHQNIEFKLWQDGEWSKKYIVSYGDETGSRDGMPVWCQTASGEYVCVIETTTLKDNELLARVHIIEMLRSNDGFNWSKSKAVYVPPVFGDAQYAGAPYVVELPDGRLCVSFQTDTAVDAKGNSVWSCNVITTKRSYKSNLRLTSFTKAYAPFGSSSQTVWNAMLVSDDKLLIFTTNIDENGSSILLRRATL